MFFCRKSVSHSFDFCTTWTSSYCLLDLDQCCWVRCIFSIKHRQQKMLESASNIGWLICAGQNQCGQVTLTSVHRYVKDMNKISWRQQTLTARRVQMTEDRGSSCLTSPDLYLHATGDRRTPCPISVDYCVKDASYFGWPLYVDWKAIKEGHVQCRLDVMYKTKEILKFHA